MRKFFPLVGFHKMGDDQLATEAGSILTAMMANAHFSTPAPSLTVLETALEDYREKLEIARRKGSPMDTTLKSQAKAVLADVLVELGSYVKFIAKGDRAIIQSSGFLTSQDHLSGERPSAPQYVQMLNHLGGGELQLKFNKVSNAVMYEYRLAEVSADGTKGEWSDRVPVFNSVKTIIGGLTRRMEYEVQVRAINRHGISPWSQPVRQIAL